MDLEQKLREALAPCGSDPQVRAALRARLAAAARPAHSVRRTPSRLFLLGTVFVVAAAAAAWQLWNRPAQEAMGAANDAQAAMVLPDVPDVSDVPDAVTTAVPAIVPPVSGVQPVMSDVPEATKASSVAVDPRTVLVVRRPELAAGGPEIALVDRCFDAVTAELRALGGLNVVADSSAFRMTSPAEGMSLSERDQEIARSHGAGYVLRVSTEHGCNFALFNSLAGAGILDAGGGGVDPQGGREYAFAKGIAQGVHIHILGDNTVPSGARSELLNPGLSDRDRTIALARLLQGRGNGLRNQESARNLFDKDVLAAVIQLGTKSPDAEVRSRVWTMLRESTDPAVIQPLLYVIANDADKSVRFQAIQSVRKFLDAPGVREALQRAATMDPDSQLERFCCTETVREAAERASVPDSEFLAWVRGKLLDESLPGRSRLINMMGRSSDGRFVSGFSRVGNDLAAVVLEIAQRDPNPRVRAMAWDVMWSNQPDREFALKELVPVLLKDLETSTNERVRAGAARILFGYRDNAEVQEAIQRAQSDDSLMVRRAATGAGMAPVSSE